MTEFAMKALVDTRLHNDAELVTKNTVIFTDDQDFVRNNQTAFVVIGVDDIPDDALPLEDFIGAPKPKPAEIAKDEEPEPEPPAPELDPEIETEPEQLEPLDGVIAVTDEESPVDEDDVDAKISEILAAAESIEEPDDDTI